MVVRTLCLSILIATVIALVPTIDIASTGGVGNPPNLCTPQSGYSPGAWTMNPEADIYCMPQWAAIFWVFALFFVIAFPFALLSICLIAGWLRLELAPLPRQAISPAQETRAERP